MNLLSENPKATITVIVSAVMVVVVYLLKSIWGIELPDEVILAVSTLLGIIFGRYIRINKTEANILKEIQN